MSEYEQDILDNMIPATMTEEEYDNQSLIDDDTESLVIDEEGSSLSIKDDNIIIDNPMVLNSISTSGENELPLSKTSVDLKNDNNGVTSNEIMALILESKSRTRKAPKTFYTAKYEPMLIHQDNSLAFIKMLKDLPKDKVFHYDLILRGNNVHCSALQIHCSGDGQVNLYYADAAGAYSNTNLLEKMVKAVDGTLFANYQVGTQKSSRGCTIFSIQDLNTLSKLNEIDLELFKETNLNPVMLKNSQSFTLINDYIKANEPTSPISKGKQLQEVANEFSTMVFDFERKEKKKKNFRIIVKELKYLKSALKILEQTYLEKGDEGIQEIIEKRWAKSELNKIYNQMRLTTEQIKKVDGVYSEQKIDLVLNHGLHKENLKNSPCFINEDTANTAYAYILAANPNTTENKNNRLQEIKNLRTSEMIDLVNKFGLKQEELLDSVYFERMQVDSNLKPLVRELLNETYNNTAGDDLSKKESTRSLFSSIHLLDDSNQVQAVVDYHLNYDLVETAYCFKHANGNEALKWIKKAYTNPDLISITQKKEAAKNMFMHIKDIINKDKIGEAARTFIIPTTALPKLSTNNLRPAEKKFNFTNPTSSPGKKKGFMFDI